MIRVADTQRRGAAGMGGRTMETSNAWDPSEDSQAERTAAAALKVKDVFRLHRLPPTHLNYKIKAQRRQIHRAVYAGSVHVDLDAIEAEAAELLLKDPAQAERFFGNRIVAGNDTWLDRPFWDAVAAPRDVPPGTRLVAGFDGSDTDDWTGLRCETFDGYQFTPTYGPAKRPCIWDPADFGGQVPRLEVAAAFDELMATYKVVRVYCDVKYWETEIDGWSFQYGDDVVLRWYTNRLVPTHAACERLLVDVKKKDGTFRHDGCETTAGHIANARTSPRPGQRYVLAKASPKQKIDLAMCSILAHEALGDAIAAGLNKPPKDKRMVVMR
jgi:hypothetical protein